MNELSEFGYTKEELAKCFVCHAKHETPEIAAARRCSACGNKHIQVLYDAKDYAEYIMLSNITDKEERVMFLLRETRA